MKKRPIPTQPRGPARKTRNAVTLAATGVVLLCLTAGIYAARRVGATSSQSQSLMAEKHGHPASIHDVSKPSTVIIDTERTEVAAPGAMADTFYDPVLAPEIGAPLVRYRPLPSPQELIKDPEFNRFGKAASREVLRALEKVIQETNQRMTDLEAQKSKIAETWARMRIEHGNYKVVGRDSAPQAGPSGCIAVTIAEAGNDFAKLVVIHPGEYAELDVIASDMEFTLKSAHAEIEALLSQ